jgi:hypothetical protein
MRVVLEIVDGPFAGQTREMFAGQTLTVGRTAKAQLMLPYDNFMSGMHFLIECSHQGCLLRDCNSSNGTWVNGNRIVEAPLNEGDQISAGQTRFRLRTETAPVFDPGRTSTALFVPPRAEDMTTMLGAFPPMPPPPVHTPAPTPPTTGTPRETLALSPQQQAFVSYLKLFPAPLFALVNVSVEERAGRWLIGSGEMYQFLNEGLALGEALPPGICLTYLPATSPLLPKLVFESWGRHWCLFFTSMHPIQDVRNHLRNLMVVQTEDNRRFLFRYWDPRLLQIYLPNCSPQELTSLFGPVHAYVVQDMLDPGKLIEYTLTPQGLQTKPFQLAHPNV